MWILGGVQRPALDDATFPDVLVRALEGDRSAAEQLFVDLQPRLLRYLRSLEPSAADDIASETWYSIARGLGSFRGDLAGFRSWSFSIARRRLIDHRRIAARRPVAFESLDDTAGVMLMGRSDDAADTALDHLSGQGAADTIARHLPPEQAEVVLLRVLGDLDVTEVAEVMGRSANWVRVNQHRALRRLAEKFGEGVIPAGDPTISLA